MKKLKKIIKEVIKEQVGAAQYCIDNYPGARSVATFDVNTGNVNPNGHFVCFYNTHAPHIPPVVGLGFNQGGSYYRITEVAIPGQLSLPTGVLTLQGVTFSCNPQTSTNCHAIVMGNECDPALTNFAPIQSPQFGCPTSINPALSGNGLSADIPNLQVADPISYPTDPSMKRMNTLAFKGKR